MKKVLKSIFAIVLILPIMLLCSCVKKTNLPSIDISAYFNEKIQCYKYKEDKQSSINLNVFTSKKPKQESTYTLFKMVNKDNKLYKMYIDSIYFYVYTNQKANEEIVVNFEMSNLKNETDFSNPEKKAENLKTTISFKPKKKGAFLCKIPIKKAVATATETFITIDILNSIPGNIIDKDGKPTNFKWTIYGFEIFGEHRVYSK